MSRMANNTVENVNPLEEYVKAYKTVKDQESALKKDVSSLSAKIKEEFETQGIDEFITGTTRAYVTVTEKEELNDLQAIEILRKALPEEQFNQVVKTREYIDEDVFESFVYNHTLDAAILAPAITKKAPTVTLRLGKVKGR